MALPHMSEHTVQTDIPYKISQKKEGGWKENTRYSGKMRVANCTRGKEYTFRPKQVFHTTAVATVIDFLGF